jgi:Na+/H+ antiporter NhaD/arsenite permease-like protein
MANLARGAALCAIVFPATACAEAGHSFGWTATPTGIAALLVFVAAYALVVFEENTGLKKSKPVMLGAGLIWALIAWRAGSSSGLPATAARDAFEHVFLEFAELFFFLVVAMAYVAALTERNVFEALRAWLVNRGYGYRKLFWITGVLAFFLSSQLDNLTTALIMSAVILAVGKDSPRFVSLAFVNLVVAANAGGAWNAFGDITTLMVWQAGKADFFEFWTLFVPSAVNFLVPALCMHFAVPAERPAPSPVRVRAKPGALPICALFAATIAITVGAFQVLRMPTVYGMLVGLALLKVYAHFVARGEARRSGRDAEFRIFDLIARAEWDTLLFFYGVIMCVGGLATIGYLELASNALYGDLGHTWANVIMGTASAVIDNIPIMYAVLQMSPPMDHGQWLLITLTAGVGGSMLSVGSAAGVALMGVSQGRYTFFSHLRWSWAVVLGYVASIATHLWWNGAHFSNGIWR